MWIKAIYFYSMDPFIWDVRTALVWIQFHMRNIKKTPWKMFLISNKEHVHLPFASMCCSYFIKPSNKVAFLLNAWKLRDCWKSSMFRLENSCIEISFGGVTQGKYQYKTQKRVRKTQVTFNWPKETTIRTVQPNHHDEEHFCYCFNDIVIDCFLLTSYKGN